MMRRISFFLLLVLLHTALRQGQSKVFTFLRSDSIIPGPSMLFDKSLASGIFEFQFKTFVETALVLYQDDKGITDHIQITFQDGRLWFLFLASATSGSSPPSRDEVFTSTKKYNDFEWHTVRIERNATVTSIDLDNGKEGESFKTFGYQSQFKTNLLIGGFKKDQFSNDLTNRGAYEVYVGSFPFWKRGFFNACVRNIKYGEPGKPPRDILPVDIIHKNKVTEHEKCQLNYCNKPDPICKNEGRCEYVKGKNVTCHCLWTGFEGKYCTRRALELTLNGTYQVRYHFEGRTYDKDKYTFRLKTRQPNAVLFSSKGPTDYSDFTLIEIKSSRLRVVVNLGKEGKKYTLTSSKAISDGNWHFIEYEKDYTKLMLKVDKTTPKTVNFSTQDYQRMDYDTESFLGEISKSSSYVEIKIQDFVWRENYPYSSTNFITGLYESYQGTNRGFSVLPSNVLPKFNRKLPSSTPKPMSNTHPTPSSHCNEGSCVTKGSDPDLATRKLKTAESQARANEDDDDSSVTWIVVVTVVFSLLLFAAVAFFVYKWNQRYSGDFQVNRKPIGPAGTVVHYQDGGHKEKQRQMKL